MSTQVAGTQSQFLELLKKSGLVEAKAVEALLNHFEQRGALPEDPAKLAAIFVREGMLTRFQAKQLLLGRSRRFFIGGKFKVLEQLGQGGMGTVYLCEHQLMRRLVAVKVLPTQQLADPSVLERFFREARAVAALDHPNLVRAYDADRDGDLYFLVMEFVDGVSLQQLVQEHGPLEIQRACHYIAQAAAGLQAAHEAGWVHRDIKPGNILLDRAGNVKLLDLGLARLFTDKADNLTQKFDDQATLGTADYLPPEQAMDIRSVDIRGDLYSLGATLYFCLAGHAPFADRETTAQKLVAHQMFEPTPLREIRPDVPARLAAMVAQMMEKNPDDRLQIPQDVVRALEPWTREPIAPPAAEEMPRWSKAIADLASQSDPKLNGNNASTVPTLSNRGQATRPLSTPKPAPARTASSPSAVSLAAPSGSSPSGSGRRVSSPSGRERKPVAKAKRKGLPPAVVAATLIGLGTLCVGILIYYVAATSSKDIGNVLPTFPGSQAKGSPAGGGGSGSNQGSQAAAPTSTQPATPRLNPATTLYVTVNPGQAPADAKRIHGSVRDALAAAAPGETVVVLDEVLHEVLTLEDGTVGKRVTLTGSRADGQPTLWRPPTGHEKAPFLRIANLEGFTLRNFQLDGNDDAVDSIISISGSCPGLRLEDLHLTQFKTVGVEVRNARGETDDPLTLRRLRIESGKKNQRQAAIRCVASGSGLNEHLLITDCRFEGFFQAVLRIEGSLTFGILRNSRFLILPQSASKSSKPHLPSDAVSIENATRLRLTVANNTILRFNNGIWLNGIPPKGGENRVVFRNNLILNMQAAVQVGSEGQAVDEAALAALFPNFEGNLCRPGSCSKGLPFLKPQERTDIDRLSDSPDDDRTFLRYDRTSKLMTAGTGGEPVGAPPASGR